MTGAVDPPRRMAAESSDCWRPDQFSNPANPEIHRRTTAEEIWAGLDGDVDAFVAGVGTGGGGTRAGGGGEGGHPPPPFVGGGAQAVARGLPRAAPPPPKPPHR